MHYFYQRSGLDQDSSIITTTSIIDSLSMCVYFSCTASYSREENFVRLKSLYNKLEFAKPSKRTFSVLTFLTSIPNALIYWTCVRFHLNEAQINPNVLCTPWTAQMNHVLLQTPYTPEPDMTCGMWPEARGCAYHRSIHVPYHSHHAANFEAITEMLLTTI